MTSVINESELPSDSFLHFYIKYGEILFGITFIIYTVTIWIILKCNTFFLIFKFYSTILSIQYYTIISVSPRSMFRYRWYIIHALTWSIIFDITFTINSSICLFPLPCFYSVGLVAKMNDFGRSSFFFFSNFVVCGKLSALLLQYVYRFQQNISVNSIMVKFDWSKWSANKTLVLNFGIMMGGTVMSMVRL